MLKEKLAILGSTGSIGTQSLEILKMQGERFEIVALTAYNNFRLLAIQANHFKPDTIILGNDEYREEFETLLNYRPVYVGYGKKDLENYTETEDYDFLLNSLVGFAGFMSTYNALKRGKKVALANKESLVVGGEILTSLPSFSEGKLIPIDSEHSAMLQCLTGENRDDIKRLIITASGGPFKDYTKNQMKTVTVENALQHPNWNMGAKITIDSSTMMNKGLEIIEAKWIFNIPVDKIVPIIHPQSIIHSIVEFFDGSSKAQMGPPDMKAPILYALTYPERIEYPNPTLDYSQEHSLEFFPVDYDLFPCLKLAMDAAKEGGFAPAILNAANEVAVERFLKKEIRYIDIAEIIETSLLSIGRDKLSNPFSLMSIDEETRKFANTLLK